MRNGHIDNNAVVIEAGRFKTTVSLQADEERTILVPMPDATGIAHMSITSTNGFRPSDRPPSTDARVLGVWIRVGG